MTRPLSIAAIVPLFNGERDIAKALDSILAQDLLPDEVIVVDDGSTDGGAGIVAAYAGRSPLVRLVSKPNGGQSSARNLGVRESTSSLLAFLDQDDVWYPDHLSGLVAPFRAWSGGLPIGWVYSDLDEVDENGDLLQRGMLRETSGHHPKLSLMKCLADDMTILPSASLVSREAFERVGGFDERLAGYEDDDLFLRLFRKGYRNVFIDEPLSAWRRHVSSTSHSPRMDQSRRLYLDKLVSTFADDAALGHHFVRDAIGPRFFRNAAHRAVAAAYAGDREGLAVARADLATAMAHLPPRSRPGARMVYGLTRWPTLLKLAWRVRRLAKASAS